MAQNNSTTEIGKSEIIQDGNLTILPPLLFAGGNLGLSIGGKVFVDIEDAKFNRFVVYSAEWILRNIDHFQGRNQTQLLAGAAIHYGLDVYALMGRDIEATKQLHREGKLA